MEKSKLFDDLFSVVHIHADLMVIYYYQYLCDLLRIRKGLNMETFCSFVDFQKAFDYVNHRFLLHKLLENGRDGNIYNIVKEIYRRRESCVLVNDRITDWFPVKSGVRQGDSLSPILFALFINDFASDLHKLGKGVSIGEHMLPILMYADDVVILANSHTEAQEQLDLMTKWCSTWGMIPNIKKSQVLHHRNHQRKRCTEALYLSDKAMDYVDNNKYLGCWVNEFGNDPKLWRPSPRLPDIRVGG